MIELAWRKARNEIRAILIECARTDRDIAYSELAERVVSMSLDARDPRLSELLGEISQMENSAGRGMLSVLVVHKDGDGMPGPGFFEFAECLGYDVSDPVAFWIKQRKRVQAAWRRPGR